MRDKIGFTDVIWILDEIDGKKVLKTHIKYNKIMLKTHSVSVINNNKHTPNLETKIL